MAAGEKLFVDLMPEEWTGAPPGLPQNVVEDLARRAREAERLVRLQQAGGAAAQGGADPRARREPADFHRYTFDIPAEVTVAADHGKDRLTLTFDAPVKFDLADVKASLPPSSKPSRPSPIRAQWWCASHSRQGGRAHVPRGQGLRRRH